jgi:hypothetical protein
MSFVEVAVAGRRMQIISDNQAVTAYNKEALLFQL